MKLVSQLQFFTLLSFFIDPKLMGHEGLIKNRTAASNFAN